MGGEAYADRGLAATQLESLLLAEVESKTAPVVAVAVPGRGGVVWRPGEVRLVGPVASEFARAIDALLEDIDLGSRAEVRDALLSIGGAHLVVDRSAEPVH
jgi:hypothetical protein